MLECDLMVALQGQRTNLLLRVSGQDGAVSDQDGSADEPERTNHTHQSMMSHQTVVNVSPVCPHLVGVATFFLSAAT